MNSSETNDLRIKFIKLIYMYKSGVETQYLRLSCIYAIVQMKIKLKSDIIQCWL